MITGCYESDDLNVDEKDNDINQSELDRLLSNIGLDIKYRINTGAISTFNWTGNLAQNATVNVTLPAITSKGVLFILVAIGAFSISLL